MLMVTGAAAAAAPVELLLPLEQAVIPVATVTAAMARLNLRWNMKAFVSLCK
jgi:hypothetical protein